MILVVGGAGYIGSHVNKLLTEKGFETVVFDSLIYGHKEFAQWGTFVQGDLADKSQIDRVFENFNIEAVMHFAAFIEAGESVVNPRKYYRNNVVCALNLLESMIEHDVKKFVFSSTCATYGMPLEIPLTETHPQNPINPYGMTKLFVEKMLHDFDPAYGLKYAALRYFNAAGADPSSVIGEWHNPETHLIPLVLDAAMGKRDSIKIFGTDYDTPDGTCVRDYIHVNDLAAAHVLALEYLRGGGGSDAFNLGNGAGFSVKEIIKVAEKVTGKPITAIETERRPGDPDTLIGTAEKAKRVLGWEQQFASIDDIIGTAWNWHQYREDKYL